MSITAAAAAIMAGGSLLGGAMSKRSAEKAQEQNYQAQKEFAQHGVRWKVEDAKAAGLHPLYALGAQTQGFSPVAIQDSAGQAVADASQHIGRAMSAQQTAPERQLQDAQLQLLQAQAQKEFTQAQYFESEAARNKQAVLQSSALPDAFGIPVQPPPYFDRARISEAPLGGVSGTSKTVPSSRHQYDSVEFNPSAITSVRTTDSSVTPGTKPMWDEYSWNGVPVVLPQGSSASEAMESLGSPLTALPVLQANIEKYGRGWLLDMMSGQKKYGRYPDPRNTRTHGGRIGQPGRPLPAQRR